MEFEIDIWDQNSLEIEKNIDQFYTFFGEYFIHHAPNDPIPSKDYYRSVLGSDNEFFEIIRAVARLKDSQKIIGYATAIILDKKSPEWELNGNLSEISIRVLPNFENEGIGTQLLHAIVNIVKESGIEKLEYLAFSESGIHLSQKYQAVPGPIGGERRVDIDAIDINMISSWIEEGKQKNPGIELFYVNIVPDSDVEDFLYVYNETINDAPSDGLDSVTRKTIESRRADEHEWENAGYTPYVLFVRHENGELSGLTELLYNKETPHIIYQELTGVLPKYRSRGIGKMIKALMVKKIMEEFPEVKKISTGTADTNKSMTSINERIGFTPYRNNQFFTLPIKNIDLSNKE